MGGVGVCAGLYLIRPLPFLLGQNTAGWFNTTRSVADATVGVLVQPIVFGINTSGMVTNAFPDLERTAALKPYADKGIETVVSLFPWIGSPPRETLDRREGTWVHQTQV